MLELFIKGGPIMWPLLLSSLITVAVVAERLSFLVRENSKRRQSEVLEIQRHVLSGEHEKALCVARNSEDQIAQILAAGLEHAEYCFEEAISTAAEAEFLRYDRGSGVLDTIVTLAPLLGLLGTVTGMIRSFGLLGTNELGAPVAITGGIAEALIATAFGLGIAISALIPLNVLHTVRERLARDVEDAASKVEIALKSRSRAPIKQMKAA